MFLRESKLFPTVTVLLGNMQIFPSQIHFLLICSTTEFQASSASRTNPGTISDILALELHHFLEENLQLAAIS